MDKYAKMIVMHKPAHPGEVLRHYLPKDMSITEVARTLYVSRTSLSTFLNQKSRLSATLALRLSTWLGTSPDLWLGMQVQWDLQQAKRARIPKIKPLVRSPLVA
jgi:addiction module HigA family antidote